jgi:hypothetical protein
VHVNSSNYKKSIAYKFQYHIYKLQSYTFITQSWNSQHDISMCLEGSYELITATRFDPFLSTLAWNDGQEGPSDFLLLQYHLDRLAHAVELHGWDHAKSSLTYDRLKSACQTALTSYDNQEDTLKVRLTASGLSR